jgi:hypothetical protein
MIDVPEKFAVSAADREGEPGAAWVAVTANRC